MQELQPTHAIHVSTRRNLSMHANWPDLTEIYQDAWILQDLECTSCHVGEG